MIVSQVPPSLASPVRPPPSSLRINLRIFPLGACMANFAGFFVVYALLVVLGLEPDAEELDTDMADEGRIKGMGDDAPGFGDPVETEDGCWRTAKTKVLLTARR